MKLFLKRSTFFGVFYFYLSEDTENNDYYTVIAKVPSYFRLLYKIGMYM